MSKVANTNLLLDVLQKADGKTGFVCDNSQSLSDIGNREIQIILESHLSAFFYPLTKEMFNENIPDSISKIAFKCYYDNIGRNSLLLNALKEIARACSDKGIQVAPLKGADLLLNEYENIGLRQLSDLDVLIRKSDLIGFREVMRELGYTETPMLPRRAAVLIDHPSPYLYVRKGLHVDLHLKLNKKKHFDLTIEDVWTRASKKDFEGVDIWRLESLDFLIHLCVHLHKHFVVFNHKTIHFLDIKLFIQKNRIEIVKLMHRASEYGCEREVSEIIYLLETFVILGLHDPGSALNISEDESFQLKKNFTMSLEMLKDELVEHAKSEPYFRIPQLSKKDQLRYILFYLFPDREFVKGVYRGNSFPYFILYVHRLFTELGNILRPRLAFLKRRSVK
jgi:hypothetical protein